MTMNTMHLAGSDVFKALYVVRTDDLGKHWTEPKPSETMGARWENVDGKRVPVAASDFVPQWHAASGKLLGTGHTVVYTPDWKIRHRRPRHTVYSVYNTQEQHWEPWKRLAMPDSEKFYNCGAGSTSWWDQPDGTILLPMYFVPPGKNSRATVARCRFDGRAVAYIEHGDEIAIDDNTRCKGTVGFGIDGVDTVAEESHRLPATVQRTLVSCGVDTLGKTADNRESCPAQVTGELVGGLASLRCRIAAADDRQRREMQRVHLAVDVQTIRWPRNLLQECGIVG
jgi:hypothetical protein